MKSIVFALIATILYAIQNTLIDVKLKQYSTVSLLLGFYLILLPLGIAMFLFMKFTGQPISIPSGEGIKIVAVVAISFFVADFFFVGAYTSGGNVVTITIILVLMPVIGAIIKFLWVKEIPTSYHIVGFIFAALAVTFIAIGNSKKPISIEEATPDQQMIKKI